MKDAGGGVLYVGKAASLRSRLRSYFASNADASFALTIKLGEMMPRVEDFEYIVTDSEAEPCSSKTTSSSATSRVLTSA